MVRVVIQLTNAQLAELKAMALGLGCSVGELVRQGVQLLLARNSTSSDAKRRALAASGRFRSGLRDLARQHDRHLSQEAR